MPVPKEKVRVERQNMPHQEAAERIQNFNEVALGYSEEQALLEASRCLDCKKPTCMEGCPVEVDIPVFIKHIKAKEYQMAIDVIKKKNNLPAICGRVCPQENQCEKYCVLGKKFAPVAIGRLERFAADWEFDGSIGSRENHKGKSGKKVAVVGSGPAGLTAAADLAMYGHQVTVFEALHTAGGVLVYGIP
jgi:glutamate synthase (NADPH/NADH) small chain